MSLNKVMLIGRLGSDPELRYTQGGQPVANFNLATNERWNDKNGQSQERTEWHRVVVWGKLAELCEKYLKKGRQAYVEGRLQTNSWDDKDGNKRYTTEVVAQTVQFLDGGSSGGGGGPSGRDDGPGPGPESNFDQSFNDDDIPF
ncbi:single-stranded DNA-binding protein [Microvenator marinus]|jgi:single-strand DNA-binding protein|uniref:Single-stranded DNA-binding protein n=1 Tax=Microvenator marinus TaxID=2600177 RepID=A0A5B8XWC5_9DELT|nr:single-stranded DNA-binding protein [Microvenator marinus]QED27769.1 single-stranded DNA-binding protein [Microvenator marinus]